MGCENGNGAARGHAAHATHLTMPRPSMRFQSASKRLCLTTSVSYKSLRTKGKGEVS